MDIDSSGVYDVDPEETYDTPSQVKYQFITKSEIASDHARYILTKNITIKWYLACILYNPIYSQYSEHGGLVQTWVGGLMCQLVGWQLIDRVSHGWVNEWVS